MDQGSEFRENFGLHALPGLSIGFDAKRALYNRSGLGNYSRTLLDALARNNPEHEYFLFTPQTAGRIKLERDNDFRFIEPQGFIGRMFRNLWRRKLMVKDIKNLQLDIFHGLSHELPFGIEKTGIKTVVTVHDIIFMRFPEYYKPIDVLIYKKKLRHACKIADKIIAISYQTKSDLIEFFGIDPVKISVIYQGCNTVYWQEYSREQLNSVKEKYKLPVRYLLYVGTIEDRKNLLGVIKGMHMVEIEIPLVVIGRKTGYYYKKIAPYINQHNLTNIFFPERVENIDFPLIYSNAECFIYPSFFEGFGIPLLEALVSGTPVITSAGGCFSEAAGPESLYINPGNPAEIGEAIYKIVSNPALRSRMIEAGKEFAKNFRNDLITPKYIQLYSDLKNNVPVKS